MKTYFLYRQFDKLYHSVFWLYLPLYALYKTVTDRAERRLFRHVIKSGDCVLDIGANIGMYTRYFAKLVGATGEVHAFEPAPANFRRLTQLTARLQNVRRYQAAVGNVAGQAVLYVSDELNVDHHTYPTAEQRATLPVQSVRLDDLFPQKKVDVIKMDIQGYEYQALLGMEQLLRHNNNIRLLMELWPYGLQQAGSDYQTVLAFLQACGFGMYLIRKNDIVPLTEIEIDCQETTYYNLFLTRQPCSELC